MTSPTNPIAIRATVDPSFITKVDRLFSNKPSQVFAELLQNARRAGATTVVVNTRQVGTALEIYFRDNGWGIGNFQDLLTLSKSGWTDDVLSAEDPAGMGFFSLFHTGVKVTSGYQSVYVDQDVFLGRRDAAVIEQHGEYVSGTILEFTRADFSQEQCKTDLERVTKFGSLDVILNGTTLPRGPFLDNALYVEEHNGLRIGVFGGSPWHATPILNLHGLTLESGRVDVFTVSHALFTYTDTTRGLFTKIDVIACTELKLELPARQAIVRNDFYKTLEPLCFAVMARYVASLPEHRLYYSDYKRAVDAGIPLKPAAAALWAWQPQAADHDLSDLFFDSANTDLAPKIQRLDPAASNYLVGSWESRGPWLSFYLATEDQPTSFTLYQADHGYQGYDWYDALPILTPIGHETVPFTRESAIVESIQLAMELKFPDKTTQRLSFPVPFLVDGENESDYHFYVTADSPWAKREEPPFDIEDALMFCLFSFSDDYNSDSTETQEAGARQQFADDILGVFAGSTAVAETALRAALSEWRVIRALQAARVIGVQATLADGQWTFSLSTTEQENQNL